MDLLTIYILTVVTLFGLLVGSFLNVVAIRLPKGESFVYPPSRCTSCGHRLGPLDLIPVASYLLSRGRCRYCNQTFSSFYAWGELVTGVCFFLTAWSLGIQPELMVGLFMVSLLIVVSMTDIRLMIIPDKILLFGFLVGVLFRIFIRPLPLWDYTAAIFVGGGILYLIAWMGYYFTKQESMGGGDIKLFALLGLFLGIKLTLLTLFLASLLGLVFGLAMRAGGRMTREQPIPFGPFIAGGAFTAYLWGAPLIEWYLHLLLP